MFCSHLELAHCKVINWDENPSGSTRSPLGFRNKFLAPKGKLVGEAFDLCLFIRFYEQTEYKLRNDLIHGDPFARFTC